MTVVLIRDTTLNPGLGDLSLLNFHMASTCAQDKALLRFAYYLRDVAKPNYNLTGFGYGANGVPDLNCFTFALMLCAEGY